MAGDWDVVQRRGRKRQVSWDRAEKARLALTPYFQEVLENDLRFALTDFLIDVLHLAARNGTGLDGEDIEAIIERSKSFFADEEPEQYLPELDKFVPKK